MFLRLLVVFFQKTGAEGVDDDTPPNMKLFDATTVNSGADVASMAKRHAAAATSNSGSNVYVSFDGLVELIRGEHTPGAWAQNQPASTVTAAAPPKLTSEVSKWPKMDLATFCDDFNLPHEVQEKLCKLGVQGPHALRFIKDDDLRGEGQFMIGEVGTLHDAEERWVNHCSFQ